MPSELDPLDVAVLGGGQSALAAAFYLRRTGLRWSLFDAQAAPGAAWRHGWESLKLFSPSRWSSLPGWIMPGGDEHYPTRDEVVQYLTDYERRYEVPVRRPSRAVSVARDDDGLVVQLAEPSGRSR
jgi:putative flavoprotein involved in K+ transport